MKNADADLLFLDIELAEGEDGFEIAEQLMNPGSKCKEFHITFTVILFNSCNNIFQAKTMILLILFKEYIDTIWNIQDVFDLKIHTGDSFLDIIVNYFFNVIKKFVFVLIVLATLLLTTIKISFLCICKNSNTIISYSSR